MALRHCSQHPSFAHDCIDCHAANPAAMTIQERLALTDDGEPTGYDPYNHHGFNANDVYASRYATSSVETETVFYTRKANWFQRKMIGWLFGWRVTNES